MVFTERGGAIRLLTSRRDAPHPRRAQRTSSPRARAGCSGWRSTRASPPNRRIYTCFMSDRAARWTFGSCGGGMAGVRPSLTDRTDIVTGLPVSTGRHSGCRPRFGPDGRLWIGTGDAAMPTVPQSPTSLGRQGAAGRHQRRGRGRERARPLRPADLHATGTGTCRAIAFSPEGRAYSIEHGTGRDDEVNRLVAGAQLRLGPAAAVRPALLRRVPTDDGQGPPPGGTGRGVVARAIPTIAPSGATFISGLRLGGLGQGCWRWPCSRTTTSGSCSLAD